MEEMFKTFYTLEDIQNKSWFKQLPQSQKELLLQSFFLLEDADFSSKTFYDYSFIVMPAAKAYEGFVKDLIYQLGLISEERYKGKRFRIGKALNPELARSHPSAREALYDDLERVCGSTKLPQILWDTWKKCRNEVFHYFVGHEQYINLFSAKTKLQQILNTIEEAHLSCQNIQQISSYMS